MYCTSLNTGIQKKSSRSAFAELVQALSSPVTELLSWTEEDTRIHPQAVVLGAHLEAGKDLYPQLQRHTCMITVNYHNMATLSGNI